MLAPPMWSDKGSISCVLLRSVEPCAVAEQGELVCRCARFLLSVGIKQYTYTLA